MKRILRWRGSCYSVPVMIDFLRRLIPNQSPLRLAYHKFKAWWAAHWYRFPGRDLIVIAVTGTNGKTTTCNYLHHLFTTAGYKTGMLTTVNFKIGQETWSNRMKQTTMPPMFIQSKLREMVQRGCKVVILEVTSHAMVQNRLWGTPVHTAVFTNLSQDHLGYHGTMQAYKEAKGLLFQRPHKVSVINQDDSTYGYYADLAPNQVLPYGIQQGVYGGRNLRLRPNGTTFDFRIPNGEVTVDFPIPGRMNVYNALAAATVAVAHQISLEDIKKALESMPPVSGRVELVDAGQPYTVVVDYAHSEDSLEKLLSMYCDLTEAKLIAVFGATGGGRDKTKRPKMGAVAHKYADLIVVTDDDPYEEDRMGIIEMVCEGIPRKEGEGLWKLADRREAIRLALSLAEAGDSVVIAGKGGEEVQVIGKELIPYDDREVVREALGRTVDVELH